MALPSCGIVKGMYKHFKGDFYVVTGLAFNAETDERCVIYHAHNDPSMLWIRTQLNFKERIEQPDGATVARFTLVEEY